MAKPLGFAWFRLCEVYAYADNVEAFIENAKNATLEATTGNVSVIGKLVRRSKVSKHEKVLKLMYV